MKGMWGLLRDFTSDHYQIIDSRYQKFDTSLVFL